MLINRTEKDEIVMKLCACGGTQVSAQYPLTPVPMELIFTAV